MILSEEQLNLRAEYMPNDDNHMTVWHLCDSSKHYTECCDVNNYAIVTETAPEVPDFNLEDEYIKPTLFTEPASHEISHFLMRLHPIKECVTLDDDDNLIVYMPSARSYPHEVVWAFNTKVLVP